MGNKSLIDVIRTLISLISSKQIVYALVVSQCVGLPHVDELLKLG